MWLLISIAKMLQSDSETKVNIVATLNWLVKYDWNIITVIFKYCFEDGKWNPIIIVFTASGQKLFHQKLIILNLCQK